MVLFTLTWRRVFLAALIAMEYSLARAGRLQVQNVFHVQLVFAHDLKTRSQVVCAGNSVFD